MTDLTTAEAAALLSERGITLKPGTIKRYCQRGIFPGARQSSNRWLIPLASVEAFEPQPEGWKPGRARKADKPLIDVLTDQGLL